MKALPIAKFVKNLEEENAPKKLHVDVGPLCTLLLQPHVENLPVVIISINGRMRSGKTCILNQIAKFIKSGEKDPWIDFELNYEFEWNDDMEGVTSGIEIWPEVLLFSVGAQDIAVILVDTQGTFDGTDMSDTYKIFGLSALISSVIIYNDKTNDSQNFQRLHSFIKFIRNVQVDSSDDKKKENSNCADDFLFGKLIFLYRDWLSRRKIPYGFYSKEDPKKKHLWEKLLNKEKLTPDSEYFRSSILTLFKDVSFYTMANPGKKLPDLPEYRHSSKWDEDFCKCVIQFVEKLFRVSYIEGAVKTVVGKPLLAKDYAEYILRCQEKISKNEYNLRYVDMVDLAAESYYNDLIQKSWEEYTDRFTEFRRRGYEGDIEEFQETTLNAIKKKLWKNLLYKAQKKVFFTKLNETANLFLGRNKEKIYEKKEEIRKEVEEIRLERQKERKLNLILGGCALTAGLAAGGIAFAVVAVVKVAVVTGAVISVGTFASTKGIFSLFKGNKQSQKSTVDDDYIISNAKGVII